PVLAHVDTVDLTSPVSGIVEWITAERSQPIKAGDVIARLSIPATSPDAPLNRVTDMKLKTEAASAEVQAREIGAKLQNLENRQKTAEIEADLERLTEEARRAEDYVEQTARILRYRLEDLDTAERLRGVGAETRDAYVAAQRSYEDARGEHERAQSDLRVISMQIDKARGLLEEHRQVAELSADAAEARLELARRQQETLQRVVGAQDILQTDNGTQVLLRAPADVIVLDRLAAPSVFVTAGQPILTFYNESDLVARAFVPVRYWSRLRIGAPARLYLEGRHEVLHGTVSAISARVVALPTSIERRLGYSEQSVLPVDIELDTSPVGLPLVPGEVGKSVIED
ncbi:MAG: HlyD family efflux transporter periplasmic adaptor subunit, partial [Candidatus Eisenbacteria bacterium]|nr:HlyD family efflux transporter periplasmic adaptor subunit [Candidatus Eisenbacteria bacterium]